MADLIDIGNMFQHTAARRRLVKVDVKSDIELLFQHTAARRRLVMMALCEGEIKGFNTQPPEGG